MQEITISNHFVRAVLQQVEVRGGSPQKLLSRAGIPPRLLAESSARVTAEQFAALQAITMRDLNDELLGYSVRPLKVGTWSALCHWLILTRTLGQALKRFCLFSSLMEKGFKVEVSNRGPQWCIHFQPWEKGEILQPYAYELILFCLHRFVCWLIEDNFPLQQVHLPYPRPEHVDEYRIMFPRAECVFDQRECMLFMDRRLLERPIRQTPESLAIFLRKPLLNILVNDYNQQSWSARTRAVLRQQLYCAPTLVEVAAELDIHPKKLRRLLESEGISYSDLKSQLRRDIAIRLLTRTSDAIESIADAVGFTETSTFTRAFKQWTGVTPFTYRKQAHRPAKSRQARTTAT